MMNKNALGGMGNIMVTLIVLGIVILGISFFSGDLFGKSGENFNALMSCGGVGVGEGTCRETCLTGETAFPDYGCKNKDVSDLNEEQAARAENATTCCISIPIEDRETE